MNLIINKYILSLIFTGLIFILIPSTTYANEIISINKYFGITQQNTIIKDDIAAKTCALSSSGDIESIDKKFPN